MAAVLVPASAAAPTVQKNWCKARPSAAWHQVLSRHIVPLSRTTSLVPWTLAHDGRSFFATVYSPAFSGVARISATNALMTKIRAFPEPDNDQADGAFDGRWLVWNEYHGFTSFNDFTTWAWDSHTHELRQIGATTRGPDGQFWEGPWRQPDVRRGIATWVQGSGPDDLADVHVFDLRTGLDRIIHSGHGQGSILLAGHLVAWPESLARGAETRMQVASALTGDPVLIPPALRTIYGVSGLATDGRRIAYPNGSYTSLWWSPTLQTRPQKIVTTRGANHIDNSVQIAGRYIGFGIQPRVFVGDTRTHRYLKITDHLGWTRIDHRSLLVLYGTGSTQLDAVAPIAFVPLRDLPPMPACS